MKRSLTFLDPSPQVQTPSEASGKQKAPLQPDLCAELCSKLSWTQQ